MEYNVHCVSKLPYKLIIVQFKKNFRCTRILVQLAGLLRHNPDLLAMYSGSLNTWVCVVQSCVSWIVPDISSTPLPTVEQGTGGLSDQRPAQSTTGSEQCTTPEEGGFIVVWEHCCQFVYVHVYRHTVHVSDIHCMYYINVYQRIVFSYLSILITQFQVSLCRSTCVL